MATNLKEDKVVMGFSIALIIIVLIVLYSLARTAGESDRTMEQIREQSLLGREERYLSQELRRLQQLRHFSAMYLSMKESSIRLEL